MSDYAVVNPATGETLAEYDTLTDAGVMGLIQTGLATPSGTED